MLHAMKIFFERKVARIYNVYVKYDHRNGLQCIKALLTSSQTLLNIKNNKHFRA